MNPKEGVPSFYIKLLANLEDLLATTLKDKPAIKKMSATNTRSLNRMKLQLRKHNKGWVEEEGRMSACASSRNEVDSLSGAVSRLYVDTCWLTHIIWVSSTAYVVG